MTSPEPAAPNGRAHAVLAVLLLVGGALFAALFIASLPPSDGRIDRAPLAFAQTPDPKLVPESAWTEGALGEIVGQGASYVIYRLPLDPASAGQQAVLINQIATNGALWCGGRLAAAEGRLLHNHTHRFMSPFYARIPPDCLSEGAYIVAANAPARYGKAVYHAYVGEAESLYDVFVWRRFLMEDLPRISTGVGLLLLLLTLLYYPRFAFGQALPWFTAMLGAATAYNIHIVWVIDALGDWARWTIGYPLSALFMGSGACFAGAWTGERPERIRTFAMIACVAAIGAFFAMLAFGEAAFPIVRDTLRVVQVGAMTYALWRFAVFTIRTSGRAIWEIGLFTAAIVVFALDLWMNTTGLRSYLSTQFPIFVFVALSAAAAVRSGEAFEALASMNRLLDRKLAEKEAALADVFSRRREEEREAARVEERRRIMSDMHDGMGARLLSLATRAEAGADGPALATDIHGAVDELRLIVNAMDSAGDDLGFALGAFRQSIEPKLAAAGMSLDWRIEPGAAAGEADAAMVLQVFRILQEAVSNAVRHSGGSRLAIGMSRSGGATVITVTDDGAGLGAKGEDGKGLATMHKRAEAIGGVLKLSSAPGRGTQVSLSLPSPGAQAQTKF